MPRQPNNCADVRDGSHPQKNRTAPKIILAIEPEIRENKTMKPYITSWRAKERIETLDLPLAEDHDQPLWVKRNPDVFERELERLNRVERRNLRSR